MSNPSEKLIYNVIIKRRLGLEPLEAHVSENFDECVKVWEELKAKWESCIKETKAFELRYPVVTAFEPALIFEICIIPITESFKNQMNNPYVRNMKQNGFSETFKGYTSPRGEVLDNGYNPY